MGNFLKKLAPCAPRPRQKAPSIDSIDGCIINDDAQSLGNIPVSDETPELASVETLEPASEEAPEQIVSEETPDSGYPSGIESTKRRFSVVDSSFFGPEEPDQLVQYANLMEKKIDSLKAEQKKMKSELSSVVMELSSQRELTESILYDLVGNINNIAKN